MFSLWVYGAVIGDAFLKKQELCRLSHLSNQLSICGGTPTFRLSSICFAENGFHFLAPILGMIRTTPISSNSIAKKNVFLLFSLFVSPRRAKPTTIGESSRLALVAFVLSSTGKLCCNTSQSLKACGLEPPNTS